MSLMFLFAQEVPVTTNFPWERVLLVVIAALSVLWVIWMVRVSGRGQRTIGAQPTGPTTGNGFRHVSRPWRTTTEVNPPSSGGGNTAA